MERPTRDGHSSLIGTFVTLGPETNVIRLSMSMFVGEACSLP